MEKHITFLLLLFGLCACGVFSQSKNAAPDDTNALCNRVSEIKQLPFKDESGVDVVYDALIEAGERVVPCLIEKVSDVTVMPDPRCPQVSKATKVGDVAYFVLVDIAKINFVEMLPAKAQEKYKIEGVYAYHDYIEQKGKRKLLQSKLREWYRQKQNQKS